MIPVLVGVGRSISIVMGGKKVQASTRKFVGNHEVEGDTG
jgi:hypothetical protein